MKRLFNWGVLVAVSLLLLALSASAGTGPAAGKAKPVKPQTLVVENGLIRAFAQDGNVIGWVGRGYLVHVRSLTARASAIVGRTGTPVSGAQWKPSLAFAGSRALWNTFPRGGNSLESELVTAAPWDPRETAIDLFSNPQSPTGGTFLSGLAGDGPTLVYGKTSERCDDPGGTNCHRLDAVGGVAFVTGQYGSAPMPAIPPPVLLAFAAHDPQSSNRISQGLIAVAPAETPILTDLGNVPRVAENGPVQVFRPLYGQTRQVSSIAPQGRVTALALSFEQLAVLMERANGGKAIERYDPQSGRRIGVTAVPSTTASELSISSAGLIYRAGRRIYLFTGSAAPKLVWQASATPIGLSLEGRRIAWAVNIKGRGRIVALTLP